MSFDEQHFNPDSQLEVNWETGQSSLPKALITASLNAQLANLDNNQSSLDHLTPILDAIRLIQNRDEEDVEIKAEMRECRRVILNSVVTALGKYWNADFLQLGMDPDSADFELDVRDLYRFLVVDREARSREMLFNYILLERRRLIERFKKGIEKKNQTVAEARRVFSSFEDVVIYFSIPKVLSAIYEGIEPEWGEMSIDGCIQLAGSDVSPILGHLAGVWGDPNFGRCYVSTSLNIANSVSTKLNLQTMWMKQCERKTTGDDKNPNERT